MSIEEKILDERSKEVKKINKKFMSDTKSSEILIVILKAHLYIERELIKALTETIIDEKILKNTTFVQKLELAKSIGIIDDIGGALNKVNSIRNGYAHDIDYVFDEKIFEDLLSTLNKEDKDDFCSEYEHWKAWLYQRQYLQRRTDEHRADCQEDTQRRCSEGDRGNRAANQGILRS